MFFLEYSCFFYDPTVSQSVSSVTQSCPALWPHESQHARPPCLSQTTGVYSNSCPSESVMPSSYLILCRPFLLLPPIPPSIRVSSNESTLLMRWPKYWSFSFSISPLNEHPGLISFRMDWLDLLIIQQILAIWSLVPLPFSKSSLNILKFSVRILLKPDLENFEHYFAIMWNECSCVVIWTFFGIALLWDWNENWHFPVLWSLLSFPNLLASWVQHFNSISFYDLK